MMPAFVDDKQKPAMGRTERYWVGAFVCCWLGILWAASPTLHDVAHLFDLSHEHPTGSRFSHKQDRFQKQEVAPTSEKGDSTSLNRESSDSSPSQNLPQQNDEDAPVINVIEIAGFASVEFEIQLNQDLLTTDASNLKNAGFVPSAELGTIGPRGPPVNIALL